MTVQIGLFDSGRVGDLKAVIEKDFTSLLPRCEFRNDDANTVLCAWYKERDWKKERAVVFLDPYGMQVEWNTIEALGATKAVDLWYLFPLGVARLLTRGGNISRTALPPIVQPELMRDRRLVEVMPKWHFRVFNLSVVHLGNRYIPRPVRVFKEFAVQMTPTLFPALPT